MERGSLGFVEDGSRTIEKPMTFQETHSQSQIQRAPTSKESEVPQPKPIVACKEAVMFFGFWMLMARQNLGKQHSKPKIFQVVGWNQVEGGEPPKHLYQKQK